MVSRRRLIPGVAVATMFGAMIAGCSTFDSAGSGVKEVFVGKKVVEPDLPDRPALVVPPANAPLPVPGQPGQSASASTPNSGQSKQQ